MYSHRNGETEPPTEKGKYWFKGNIIRYGDLQDVADLKVVEFWDETGGVVVNEEGIDYLFDTDGQWWGPVVPPWDVQPAPAALPVEALRLYTEAYYYRASDWGGSDPELEAAYNELRAWLAQQPAA